MRILNEDEEIKRLKEQREKECFPIINRGKLWYDSLTYEQISELNDWYFAWLDITETKRIPNKPQWLSNKLQKGEQVIW